MFSIKRGGMSTVRGFIAKAGDIRRFTNPKQTQKLVGLEIVKRALEKGQARISKRGRRGTPLWIGWTKNLEPFLGNVILLNLRG